ncbi:hypothetical protein BKA82DRAFT_4240843 [Pisolithus tinctorius]|nr:hypothetical protein BKA82DRAFT_4240843 [Pisolithus tinctorius]
MDRDDEAENVQTAMRPQLQQRSSIPSFVPIIFMPFLLTNHNGDEFLARNHHYNALCSLTYQLSNFMSWMNRSNTNFSMPDRNPSLQPLVESYMTLGSRLDPSSALYFPNITGVYLLNDTQAPWSSHAKSYMANMNMTENLNSLGMQDWKATQKMAWSVIDHAVVEEGVSDKLAMAHGRIDFVDVTSGNEMRLDFEGVHFIANGSVYGFAEPPGYKIKTMIDNGVVDQESSEANSGVQSDCRFLVYAQIEPSLISEELMIDVESELQSPMGKWTPNVFPLCVNGVLLSRECGMLYRFYHAEGLRTQSFLRRVINYRSISGVISLIMLTLSCRQVDCTPSPAALQRLSVWTFYTQAIVNVVSLAAHTTFAILAHGRPSLALIIAAFASSIFFSIEAARIWIGLLICLAFIVRATISMYSLFWLPQIVHSVKCGRSSSLSAEYLVGMSICRLWFPFCHSVFRWVYSLAAFILFQVGVVLLQKFLGPAFFLPKWFATAQIYEYHLPMLLNMHDPEALDQPLGDCSICMEVIHVKDSKQLQQVTGGLLQKVGVKKGYSVAPCHHIFHMECLEKWLALKNICLQCRRPLLPL